MRRIRFLLPVVLLAAWATGAQPPEAPTPAADLERMAREGMTEALEARLRRPSSSEDRHLLARAYANKARRVSDAEARERAYATAREHYEAWIAALEERARAGELADVVRLAAARVEYGGLLLSGPAAGALGEYEITLGRRGEPQRLRGLLEDARVQYERAAELLAPLLQDLAAREEDLLAAGLYDVVVQSDLDAQLNRGWASYYLGVLEQEDRDRRRGLLSEAERRFQGLINSGQVGQMRYHCYMALGMAQRELGRYADAERSFGHALAEDTEWSTAAQARYELARCQIAVEKFDEARTTLRPLVEKDLRRLSPEDRALRYYINLAHVWDANSHLVEAEALRRAAGGSAAQTAILRKARRSRDTGLERLRRLAQLGGPWPGLVRIYITDSVRLDTPVSELGPMELLYTAGTLMESGEFREALTRLTEAAGREGVGADLVGDILFETGRCRYQLGDKRGAATVFARLAREHRGHSRAAEAAEVAYTLWGSVAERSEQPQDYVELAGVLQNLIASFADHPRRDEAAWLLPGALQRAGRYGEAAEYYARVPQQSERWEEAQYRRAMCARHALDAQRALLGPQEYRTRARAMAAGLQRYADEARRRSPGSPSPPEVEEWAAQARVVAAELLAAPGVEEYRAALDALAGFETQETQSELIGRVLAVRLRAYRGLGEYEQASKMLERYLRTSSPERVAGALVALATGMQAEVERRMAAGEIDAARLLAAESLATFRELESRVRADPARAESLGPVQAARARMHYLAGEYTEAERILVQLLESDPRDGKHWHLLALVLTAELGAESPTGELERAQQAWGRLLSDPGIRARAPQRYWEARYNWLKLALRLGQAADVVQAITQERVWYPELGGPAWKEKLEALLVEAEAASPAPEGGPADKR